MGTGGGIGTKHVGDQGQRGARCGLRQAAHSRPVSARTPSAAPILLVSQYRLVIWYPIVFMVYIEGMGVYIEDLGWGENNANIYANAIYNTIYTL